MLLYQQKSIQRYFEAVVKYPREGYDFITPQ